jgi:hypothetical protein
MKYVCPVHGEVRPRLEAFCISPWKEPGTFEVTVVALCPHCLRGLARGKAYVELEEIQDDSVE